MVEGNCLSVISNLKLSWKGDKDTKNSTIQLIFVNDHSKFSLFSINLNVYRDKNSSLTSSGKNIGVSPSPDASSFLAFIFYSRCGQMVECKVRHGPSFIRRVGDQRDS